MNRGRLSLGKRIFGTLAIPLIAFGIIFLVCAVRGVVLFETTRNWMAFFRATASVMLTTFALSINLNSGRFDFSIGSVALLSSVISSTLALWLDLPAGGMLLICILSGTVLGCISGGIYVISKLPPIIVSLGVTLLFEGAAFVLTDGYGVSFVTKAKLTGFPGVRNYLLVILVALAIMILIFDHTKFGYEYKALLSGQSVSVNMGIREIPNAIACYMIAGSLMGVVGFLSATNTGTIQMALNFGSIGVMFTAFLPMFIGGFIGRFSNDKLGYLLGGMIAAGISLMYAKLQMDSSVQQIVTALILVVFLIYLNNENKLVELRMLKARKTAKHRG